MLVLELSVFSLSPFYPLFFQCAISLHGIPNVFPQSLNRTVKKDFQESSLVFFAKALYHSFLEKSRTGVRRSQGLHAFPFLTRIFRIPKKWYTVIWLYSPCFSLFVSLILVFSWKRG